MRDRTAPVATVPFVEHVGLRTDADTPVVHVPDDPRLRNHVGTVHAGALFTAAETASGREIVRLLGVLPVPVIPVVGTASMRYRAPAVGPVAAIATTVLSHDDIVAELATGGRPRRSVDTELTAEDGTVVARATFEWVFLGDTTAR